jgi:hypothetical protein
MATYENTKSNLIPIIGTIETNIIANQVFEYGFDNTNNSKPILVYGVAIV